MEPIPGTNLSREPPRTKALFLLMPPSAMSEALISSKLPGDPLQLHEMRSILVSMPVYRAWRTTHPSAGNSRRSPASIPPKRALGRKMN
uniref:Predicted protein n=1 Tax=Hordeum vulgare subsp. vulgare TaxID=112509 RepID=F2DX21_HORVV|nr:predicted protein [Hordeum vulgare subsp. vulgare]